MRKFYLPIWAFSLFAMAIVSCHPMSKYKGKNMEEEEEGIPFYDRMDLAWKQEREMTMDPTLGYVPSERLMNAWDYLQRNKNNRASVSIGNFNWVNLGPKNYGGRSRAICVDLNDATKKTIFLGSVGGGLWKTTDITATEPNWQPVNDLFGNIAITSIAQDSASPQTMYFSTGEGYSNIDAIRGLGVWKSTNGGSTWSQLSATTNSSFYYCQKILVTRLGYVMVATSTGLYRSVNGGSNFSKVLGTGLGITGASSNFCYDIEQAANGVLYASLSGSLHKSTDGGATWSSALSIGITSSRIEIATAPSNANYIYILCEYSSAVAGIAISTDGGTTFNTKTEPTDADTGIPSTDFSRTQAWYDLTIAVNPSDANTIYVGGVDLFKSTNGGTSWQQISHWTGSYGFQYAHADQHNIYFEPDNSSVAYFLNDGGIFRTTNATATIPTISSKNSNYCSLQFYGCAMSPVAGSYDFVAGAQDNGSHKFSSSLMQNTIQVTGGDGVFCHIDQNESQYWFTSYVYNNYYRSSDGGNTFTSVSFGNTGRFVNPTDYDDIANIMYCANGTSEYVRWDNPQTGSTFTTVSLTSLAGQVSAIKVSPNTSNRVFFGTSGGKIVRADNANTATPTATVVSTGLPSAYISCIEVETGNDNHLLVTFSSYGTISIWESTNGGTSWTSVEGNLPDMPVRWVLFNPNNNDQAVIATELGVWSTDNLNGTSTVWGSSNDGLANVRVDMLQVRQSDKMLIAATHGRGLYYSGVFAPPTANFVTNSLVVFPNVGVNFTNTSLNATSYSWNFGDGNTSSLSNPTNKYAAPGSYVVSLSINGGASTVNKMITVLPAKGIPYLLANGGNFESTSDFAAQTINGTGWALGNSTVVGKNGTNSGSNAWVTGLTGNYVDNSEAYLYTPVFNCTAVGTYGLSFYTKYNCEANYDGFRVEYSIDTGKIWQPLGTTVATNWYNFANTTDVTAFTFGQAFFSGSFGTSYAKKTYDISSLAGNANVSFRFAFKSDAGVTGVGVAIDDIEITGPNNVVPLQLLDFSVVKKNANAVLSWSTLAEKNVASFLIERSTNGTNFSGIGSVLASNNINGSKYSFTNFIANSFNQKSVYYRINMLDKDGSYRLSNIVRLSLNGIENSISVYPNPFTTQLQVEAPSLIKLAELIDNNGRVVFSTSSILNGKILVSDKVAKGNYILRLHFVNEVVSQKVVKM